MSFASASELDYWVTAYSWCICTAMFGRIESTWGRRWFRHFRKWQKREARARQLVTLLSRNAAGPEGVRKAIYEHLTSIGMTPAVPGEAGQNHEGWLDQHADHLGRLVSYWIGKRQNADAVAPERGAFFTPTEYWLVENYAQLDSRNSPVALLKSELRRWDQGCAPEAIGFLFANFGWLNNIYDQHRDGWIVNGSLSERQLVAPRRLQPSHAELAAISVLIFGTSSRFAGSQAVSHTERQNPKATVRSLMDQRVRAISEHRRRMSMVIPEIYQLDRSARRRGIVDQGVRVLLPRAF